MPITKPSYLPAAEEVAVVTGGGQGVGAAIAERLEQSGIKVFNMGLRSPVADTLSMHIQVDIANASQIKAALAELCCKKNALYLVNNAGVGSRRSWRTLIWRRLAALPILTFEPQCFVRRQCCCL